jgi:hypothetical protein
MPKFAKVLVFEVEEAKDKNAETPGGKYRKDTPWLVEAFKKKGVQSDILFITAKDTAESLKAANPNTAFLGRVNPMDYPSISLDHYLGILNGLKKDGLLLGPDPHHMDVLGAKSILYDLRASSMGCEGVLWHKLDDMKNKAEAEFDRILPKGGPCRVLKMMRGSTGLGVWKLENTPEGKVLMTDAYTQTTEEIARAEVIPRFLSLCKEDAISMPYLPLIKDGEFRFLMSKHKVLAVVHKRPVDASAFTATLRSGAVYTTYDPEAAANKPMVDAVVNWTHELQSTMKLDDVPYWWSVDCIDCELTGDKAIPVETTAGSQQFVQSVSAGKRLVLSEINCSCLGLVADTSAEAAQKGMKFAEMIADVCLA